MSEEIEFDINLLYLENLLLSLDMFHFDKDIVGLLNELQTVVCGKLYSPCIYHNKDIKDVKYKMLFEYE